jgi:hypothetical protein
MKDRYIQMRNSGRYDLKWFYEHYIQNSRDSIDINNFGAIFNSVNLESVLEHIDRKFNLVRVYDKDNNFIMVYEGTADTDKEN